MEAAEACGVTAETIRRDRTLLERLGFDLEETIEEYGRKRWRLRRAFERPQTRQQRCREIGVLLDQASEHANALDDGGLEKELETLRKRVGRE